MSLPCVGTPIIMKVCIRVCTKCQVIDDQWQMERNGCYGHPGFSIKTPDGVGIWGPDEDLLPGVNISILNGDWI